MYNYQAPGQYGRPPGYGGYPGQTGTPPGVNAPGIGPPGSTGPPGMGAPPGVASLQNPLPNRPTGLPPSFQPPANMPNINFSAPVIRLGTSGPGKGGHGDGRRDDGGPRGGRGGLGMGEFRGEGSRGQMRETMAALVPPTREEIARTIFVGKITPGVGGNENMERILRSAGHLRRWTRATNADGKEMDFGFAEFEDAESLETAAEVLQDVVVPSKRVEPGKSSEEEPEKSKLLVIVDDASKKYAEEWRIKRDEDPSQHAFRVDTAREALAGVLASLFHPVTGATTDADGDTAMRDEKQEADPVTGEIITIPISVEDELSDIPAEMREIVAAEIAAFRERSNRRDQERLKREEELESVDKQRGFTSRLSRLASPPPTAPTGPGNSAQSGPAGAPSGPKALAPAAANGVSFVNGAASGLSAWLGKEDEDTDASDSELERRRVEKKRADQSKLALDQSRRWENRERSRAAAVEREKARDEDDVRARAKAKASLAQRLREWDDAAEAARKAEDYYQDRSLWLRKRQAIRGREAVADDRDRAAEEQERAKDHERRVHARDMADSFLSEQAREFGARGPAGPAVGREPTREPARFKMSLGAAAQRAQAAAAPRRTVAEVEGLLEDEEEEQATGRRTLIPIQYDPAEQGGAGLSDEERAQAVKALAAEIPTDTEGLWKWAVRWEFVDEAVVTEQLKPFVEKKIVEYLGVQEQMLVDVVEEHIRKRGDPAELVGELEGALDEEAESLVKKLWRMIIFFSESEKRGLST